MLKKYIVPIVASLSLVLTSCAKIYYSPDAFSLAKTHSTIAVLPPTVSIAAGRKTDAGAIMEQQRTESLNFQKEMYSWLLKRKRQGTITQEILDIETTNAKLRRAGYPETPLTPFEMCEILGVQGVMLSNYALSKPMSDGAGIALAILGVSGTTNEVRVSLSINDCDNKKLIFNYDHKFSGGLGSSPARLVESLMAQASRKMPYFKN
jgi:hypothetical protein